MAKNRKRKTGHRRDLAALRGRERAEHFANGGTTATWRGAARTYDNKTKARASKNACRGRVDY
jgi:hypothetical protein